MVENPGRFAVLTLFLMTINKVLFHKIDLILVLWVYGLQSIATNRPPEQQMRDLGKENARNSNHIVEAHGSNSQWDFAFYVIDCHSFWGYMYDLRIVGETVPLVGTGIFLLDKRIHFENSYYAALHVESIDVF